MVKGGHSVPAAKIFERYIRSLEVLIKSIPFFDRVFIFDNSLFEHRLIASIAKGKIENIYSDEIPVWVKKIMKQL